MDVDITAVGCALTGDPPETFPGHNGGRWAPVAHEVVASWPAGHFAENLAVDPSGIVYVSLHSHHRIDRYDPRTRKLEAFASFPAPAAGLAFDQDGSLWVTGGAVGQAPGYVWRVGQGGTVEVWVEVPNAVFMNGCTPHSDGQTLLVCESVTGRILAVDQHQRRWRAWLTDDRLRPTTPQMPGANGIKIRGAWAWISVTDHDVILRTPIGQDGQAGPLEVAAEHLHADDFAFGSTGATYIATHVAQTVLRLAPDGTRETIAGPDEGAVGSTACAFGRASGDKTALYVTTTGGMWGPYRGQIQDAKLLRLEVAETGRPLLPDP
jgi:sugar lactone lactonase YvrE